MSEDNELYRTIGNIESGLKNLDNKVTLLAIDVKTVCDRNGVCREMFVRKEKIDDLATKSYVKKWGLASVILISLLILTPDLVSQALERLIRIAL